MENWGLITYCEYCLLVDQNEAAEADKSAMVDVNAHEIGKWFPYDWVILEWVLQSLVMLGALSVQFHTCPFNLDKKKTYHEFLCVIMT